MPARCNKWVAMMRERATQIATERGTVSMTDLYGYEEELAAQGILKPHPRAYQNVFLCRKFIFSHRMQVPCVNILDGREVDATRWINCYRIPRPEDDHVPTWNGIPPFDFKCRTAGRYNV